MATRSLKAIKEFVALMDELMVKADDMTPSQLAQEVLASTGYRLELTASNDPQDESRLENLDEMVSVASEFEEANPEGTLVEFLEQVSLVADADQIPAADGGQGVVTLMTLHTAKGLEFPVVFLTGMEDGVFPHMRSLGEPKELEEERRLAYVGITRPSSASTSPERPSAAPGAHPPSTRPPGSSPRSRPSWSTGAATRRRAPGAPPPAATPAPPRRGSPAAGRSPT